MEVDERQRILFPEGILGFEQLKEYVLFDAAQPPFYWLQSTERVETAFVLIEPKIFRPDYSPDVDREELTDIGIASEEDLLVFAIVTIPENAKRMTANLQGPLILNKRTRVGRQSVSTNPKWGVRHVILDEMRTIRQGSC
jgi:flagellar assembly factor FliW